MAKAIDHRQNARQTGKQTGKLTACPQAAEMQASARTVRESLSHPQYGGPDPLPVQGPGGFLL